MNRVIALFVALAMLLAHALAIHDDGLGRFAYPYDQAYAALRLARNLVYDDQLAWNPGTVAFESYPSMLWVAVCTVAERIGPLLHLSTNIQVQSIGIASALATLVVLSRFRAGRTASLIAPLFLATSGAFAAGAASGLELTLLALLATGAFYALEHGRSVPFAVLSAGAVLAHPFGILLVVALAAIRAFGRPNVAEGAARRTSWVAFAAPVATFLGASALRSAATGFALSPDLYALSAPVDGQWTDGLASLSEFAIVGVTPLLVVFPAAWLVLGSLSRTGAHAVFLALAWCGVTVLAGRCTLPFHVAFVPALPFLFLAVQEGMIAALDGVSLVRRRITLVVFATALLGSALASRTPGDLGPLPLQALHETWLRPLASARFDCEQPLGRLGLEEEIGVTRRLRKAGIYLRENAEPTATILTPWPGAIGYLSRLTVHDVLGRTDPIVRTDRPQPWWRRVRVDLVASLARDADFVVPYVSPRARPPTLKELARSWAAGLDAVPDSPERRAAIERALVRYELVTVPVEDYTREGASIGREPFLLLRHYRLERRPALEVRQVDGEIRVGLRKTRMPQLAELELRLLDEQEQAWTIRPTGELDESCKARARVGLLLYDSGNREIELCRLRLPPHPGGLRWVNLTARLLNPGSRGEGDPWEAVSERASFSW